MNDKFGDPAYGVGKELKVEYTGYYVSMGEYAGRNVPGIKEVITATYGADNRQADVTSQVSGMLRGETLELAGVDMNACFEIDPAYGVEKQLNVTYVPASSLNLGNSPVYAPQQPVYAPQPVHAPQHSDLSSSERLSRKWNGFLPCGNCECQSSGKRRKDCRKWHWYTDGKCVCTQCHACRGRVGGRRRLAVPKEAAPEPNLTITTTTPLFIDSASPSSKEDSQKGSLSEGRQRRRLVEAAYFAFIGFNMLLMCCLLVGISFAYHVGTREANYAPIRW